MKNPIHWEASDCLFVFGSLMDPEVLELVSGLAELTINAATVEGFRQCEVSEESYPVLVADEASVCHGLLVGGLTVLAVQRILFFEGGEYTLEPITVTGDDTATELIEAYYFKDTGAYTVKAESWGYEHPNIGNYTTSHPLSKPVLTT